MPVAKKRSAPTKPSGPVLKKTKMMEGGEKQKRSRPVTKDVEEDDEENEEDEEDEDNDESTNDRATQKALHAHRKSLKPHASLLSDAKSLWALARAQNISSSERQKHIKNLMECIRGKIKDIVFKHDASRIVQTIVKYGGKDDREEIARELDGKWNELARSRYSKFLLTKLLRLLPSSSLRLSIYKSLAGPQGSGSVLKLLLHREASGVLADAFELYANAQERNILLREFYGKEVSLFNDNKNQNLQDILSSADAEKRKRVLKALRENIENIFNNPDKGAIEHAIVHRALWEYLEGVSTLLPSDQEPEKDKLRKELFDLLLPHLPSLVHTPSGSRVVREFIARGSAKDRKTIIKQLKPHVVKMASDEEASLVLWCLWDCVDDTKLIQKSLLIPLLSSSSDIRTILSTPTGRRTILYLLVPRSTRHFTPALIRSISETDKTRDEVGESKKDVEVRRKEIAEGAAGELVGFIEESLTSKEEKGLEVVTDPALSLVTTEIMLYAEATMQTKQGAIRALCETLVSEPYPSLSSTHPVDLPHTSRLYKTLLQGGHYSHHVKAVEKAPRRVWDRRVFGCELVEASETPILVEMCTKGERGGAFVVAELIGALLDDDDQSKEEMEVGKDGEEELKNRVKAARSKLKESFEPKKIGEEITKGEGKGWKVLLEKVGML
ncbi:Pumilio y domain member 6 [Stygiomarasmius scandens]|uniref:Pumilio y domain member 6 n=1 Tax=Marasmiellus scandens TaxID=2682957 RepID=A0ABR1ISN5_9AGAR